MIHQVNTLLCKKHLQFAIPCLKSFVKSCLDDFNLHIYEDGSLDQKEIELLEKEFPGSKIHKSEDVKERTMGMLSSFPNCLKYKLNSNFSLKLIDIPLDSPDQFSFVDSDILFFRKFKNLDRSENEEETMVFMKDAVTYGYSLSFRDRYLGEKKIKLPDKINSGFMFVDKEKSYDLEYIDWFLGRYMTDISWRISILEQSCWAGLASRVNAFYWDTSQIQIPLNTDKIGKGVVAFHFIHNIRDRMEPFYEQYFDEEPIKLKTSPVTYRNKYLVLAEKIYERVTNKL